MDRLIKVYGKTSVSNIIHVSYITYHIFIFTKHAKKHINKHVKGENSQKAKRGQKRAITQLRKKTTSNLPTKESNTRKKNKLTLPIPSKPSMKRNQQHIKHTIIQRWRIHRTHSHRNKTKQTKTKHQNKPSSKNKKALHIYIIGKKICCPSVAF